MSVISAAPVNVFSDVSRFNEKSRKNTAEIAHKHNDLMNHSKDYSYKDIERENASVRDVIVPRAHDVQFHTDNRFAMLVSSSSNDSLNEIEEDKETAKTPMETVTKFIVERDREILNRYKRDVLDVIDAIKVKHSTDHITDSKFDDPGDSIYRNYWRYTILRDGSIHCVNAASNRKKITQLVLRIKTAPFEFINGKPVTNYFAMFRHAECLHHISLSGLNFSHIRSVGRMFSDCFLLKTVDMSNLDLSNVQNYQHMFDNCRSLRTVDFSGCNMRSAVKLDSMFYGCMDIIMITLTGLTGESVESMNHMFRSCESLRILELPNLIINDSVEMKKIFYGANKAIDIVCPSEELTERYLKDKYEESSSSDTPSSSPSIDVLSEQETESTKPELLMEFLRTPGGSEERSFPHVLTEEQRATAFKWAPPPESIVPSFI
jgi:hypothetical protein